MSAFREVLKASPEYKDLAGAVRGGRLPLGVLGLSPIHKAHLIDTLCSIAIIVNIVNIVLRIV